MSKTNLQEQLLLCEDSIRKEVTSFYTYEDLGNDVGMRESAERLSSLRRKRLRILSNIKKEERNEDFRQ